MTIHANDSPLVSSGMLYPQRNISGARRWIPQQSEWRAGRHPGSHKSQYLFHISIGTIFRVPYAFTKVTTPSEGIDNLFTFSPVQMLFKRYCPFYQRQYCWGGLAVSIFQLKSIVSPKLNPHVDRERVWLTLYPTSVSQFIQSAFIITDILVISQSFITTDNVT